MIISAVYSLSLDRSERPKEGWLIYYESADNKLLPVITQRGKQLKVSTIDQMITEIRRRWPDEISVVKLIDGVTGTLEINPVVPKE